MSEIGGDDVLKEESETIVNLSQELQSQISKNSELGTRLLSLLLVSSSNGKEIIGAINRGDISRIKNLNFNAKVTKSDIKEDEIDVIKRKKSTEASARFRIRKKQREQERQSELKELNIRIQNLNKRVDVLLDENRYWKRQLEKVNDRKSEELLESIRRRNQCTQDG
ncbi:hypothetical protein HG536_0F03440 [Torulaspora globosa]|uniref:BZIP domain-containing protein n=1 Tax=Torulaspora globosa TaxID=48254 RepID=A0A7G3ZKI3_9SACH|nr:uncharacterized protein HG536_0F03440 [Torulaspora globosa]QLL34019.1 hypothetical protein HG536_0F03440 [Torulaspora globosa]